MTNARCVTVETGSRLHFGLMAVGAATGRRFGGAGLMIDSPKTSLQAQQRLDNQTNWLDGVDASIADRVRTILRSLGIDRDSSLAVTFTGLPPAHVGLGSGTQLTLALATAILPMKMCV